MAKAAPLRKPVAATVWIERSASKQRLKQALICQIGREIEIANDVLEAAAANHLSWASIDLLAIAAAVAFTDRMITRRRSIGWGRQLTLHLPVYDLQVWRKPRAHQALEATLLYLTGDHWKFVFRQETQPFKARQHSLPLDSFGDVERVVMPFSDGLDSYSQWQLLTNSQANLLPIRITTKTNNISMRSLWQKTVQGGKTHIRVGVMLSLRGPKLREQTYRSRGFIFCVIAAVAAQLFGATRVLIPENGQGAIGPSLLTSAGEWPLRGTYPGFTTRLANLVQSVLGQHVSFEHPALWNTKGEVLAALASIDKTGLWQTTRSCSRSVRNLGGKSECGICGGCLLRRMSVDGAALTEPSAKYIWSNLNEPQLRAPRSFRTLSATDIHIAHHNALQLQWLARHGSGAPTESDIETVIRDLATALKVSSATVRQDLERLLNQHRKEWNSFVASLSSRSWISVLSGNV